MITATLESYTCITCGYTEFYADRRCIENIKRNGRFPSESPQSSHSDSYRQKCYIYGSNIPYETKFCPQCGFEFT